MSKATLPTFPAALTQLANLGQRLRLARRRRCIAAGLFAERMGVSRETLRRLEKGDPTIAIGTYLRALRVLGLDKDIEVVAADDVLGRKLQDIALLGSQGQKNTMGASLPHDHEIAAKSDLVKLGKP